MKIAALKTGRSYLHKLGIQESTDLYRKMSKEEFCPSFFFFISSLASLSAAPFRPVDNKCVVDVNSRMATDRKYKWTFKLFGYFMDEHCRWCLAADKIDLTVKVGLLTAFPGRSSLATVTGLGTVVCLLSQHCS